MTNAADGQADESAPLRAARHTPWAWPPGIIVALAVVDGLGAKWGWLIGLAVAAGAIALLVVLPGEGGAKAVSENGARRLHA